MIAIKKMSRIIPMAAISLAILSAGPVSAAKDQPPLPTNQYPNVYNNHL